MNARLRLVLSVLLAMGGVTPSAMAAVGPAVGSAVRVPAAASMHTSDWYWTPGASKSSLTNRGVQIDDGRFFHPTLAFCIGLSSTGAWNYAHTTRLYKSFYVIMRSGDGVVRTMNLRITGQNSWRGSDLRLRSSYMGGAKFAVYTRVIATAYAQQQNEYGCKSGVLGP